MALLHVKDIGKIVELESRVAVLEETVKKLKQKIHDADLPEPKSEWLGPGGDGYFPY